MNLIRKGTAQTDRTCGGRFSAFDRGCSVLSNASVESESDSESEPSDSEPDSSSSASSPSVLLNFWNDNESASKESSLPISRGVDAVSFSPLAVGALDTFRSIVVPIRGVVGLSAVSSLTSGIVSGMFDMLSSAEKIEQIKTSHRHSV